MSAKRFTITAKDKAALAKQVPCFAPAVRNLPLKGFALSEDPFFSICESIASQQLSVRVADAIFGRLKTLLGGTVTPEALLAADDEALRACGLSRPKIRYLKGISEAVRQGSIDLAGLYSRPHQEVVEELVKLPGIGLWTAEMLLIFCFGNRDVFSWRDLGVRNGLKLLSGQEPTQEFCETIQKQVSPYGTLASLYCWAAKDNRPMA